MLCKFPLEAWFSVFFFHLVFQWFLPYLFSAFSSCGHQKWGRWMVHSKLQEVLSQLLGGYLLCTYSTAHTGSWQQIPLTSPGPLHMLGWALCSCVCDIKSVHKLIPSQWTDWLSQKEYKWRNHKDENTDKDILDKFHVLLHWETRIWNCSRLKMRCYSIWFLDQEFKSDKGG